MLIKKTTPIKPIPIKRTARLIAVLLLTVFLFNPAQVYASPAPPVETLTLFYDGATHTYVAPRTTLQVNGRTLTGLPMPPIILEDRTLVPARETFEALGAAVIWQHETREVYIGFGGRLVVFQIDNPLADVDGVRRVMDVPPKIINDKTMIPVRFASEALGFEVDWDGATRTVFVNDAPPPKQSDPPPSPPPSPPPANVSADTPVDISTEKIPDALHPETQITNVNIPADGASVFSVTAAGPISKVDTFPLMGNRIVLDFYNAELSAAPSTRPVGSPLVDRIRMAQNQTEPEKITRVVFDLNAAATYRVSISSCRTEVFVIFESNSVSAVRFNTDSLGDYVEIDMQSAVNVNVFHLARPDRLVIDVPHATLSDVFTRGVNGRFTHQVRTGLFEATTARVVLDLTQRVQHTVTVSGSTVTVRVSDPTFRNISYDDITKTITLSKGGRGFRAADTLHVDAYDFGMYVLTLPVDLSAVIGYGEFLVTDDHLRSIVIQNNSAGLTELVLHQQRVFVAQVTEDTANVYIKLVDPREVYDRIVVIDPGHGGRDEGASHFGLLEKDLNLTVAQKAISLLEHDGRIKVYATRKTDRFADLSERSRFGNTVGDLFVSIHHNASDRNPNAHGTEVYYFRHEFDNQLWITGKDAADIMHRRLTERLDSNPRRVVHNNLSVIREATVPAVFLEIGFMSNAEEAMRLGSPEYQWLAAQAIFEAVIEIFERHPGRLSR
ncbi:MAG: N-acetylmuramoyl-L-alanine amidase family protein [Defluviitaleaceae bacterium]|nr:N-acetylmuramoyl-L-alanine amidase family protein [Defluviitaleaceae bacterium]